MEASSLKVGVLLILEPELLERSEPLEKVRGSGTFIPGGSKLFLSYSFGGFFMPPKLITLGMSFPLANGPSIKSP